jgi:hypothetical protein
LTAARREPIKRVPNPPDYHVVSMTYSVKSTEDVTYDAPPPVEFETDEAHFRLVDAKLTCQMKVHFSTAEEARAVVNPVLRAWELDADLRLGNAALRFQYEDAEIVDRTPQPPGTVRGHVLFAGVGEMVVAEAAVSAHVTRRAYPAPPCDFRITPDVATLSQRYQGYLEGREPLPTMAYFCLTVLEAAAGGGRNARRKAATMYNIKYQVLKKLGELTSVRGDHSTARKMLTPETTPLSGEEDAWIQATIKQIIWRLGDQRSPATLPTITMAALPRLKPIERAASLSGIPAIGCPVS